jgi:hypothetical protein
MVEINKKTDLRVVLKSLERLKHRKIMSLTFEIEAQVVPKVD